MSGDDLPDRAASVNGDRSDEPLDAVDDGVLRRLGGLLGALDGPPEGFTERMRFAVAARGLADELARLTEAAPVSARGQDRPARTWTFEAASLTILVTAEPTRDGTTRVDGWLAPAGQRTVRLRQADGAVQETVADELGRFGYPGVPRGLVQVVVVGSDEGAGVVTPTFEL